MLIQPNQVAIVESALRKALPLLSGQDRNDAIDLIVKSRRAALMFEVESELSNLRFSLHPVCDSDMLSTADARYNGPAHGFSDDNR